MKASSREYWFPRRPKYYGPVRINLGCTRTGLIFIAGWQAVLWGAYGLFGLLGASTDLRHAAFTIIFVVGISIAAVKAEWGLIGDL